MPKISVDNYDTVASWNGNQDLLIVEQPDGTKVATPNMVRQFMESFYDDVPTEDSNNAVKSGGIFNAVDDVYSVMGQMGAKNLLVPEWTETRTTENGVTYTFNADGTIIMNTDESGATADTNCNLRNKDITTNNLFPAGSYTFTGCPAGGSSTKYRTWLRAYRPNTNIALTTNLYEAGEGVSFTVSEPFTLGINATVRSGYVCNNLTWKPMLQYASDTDNTYQPYAKTNKQLTDGLDTAREQIAEIHPNANTLSAPVFESHTALDDVMKFYETGNDDYKAIRVYDKNNVNRYSLIFTGGHLKFTSKDASGTTIVDTTIV